jgi:Cellulase (glycosyl hydrolase family 5)
MKLPLERALRAGLGLAVILCLVLSLLPVVSDRAEVDSSATAFATSNLIDAEPQLLAYNSLFSWPSYSTILASTTGENQPKLALVGLSASNRQLPGPGRDRTARGNNGRNPANGSPTTTTTIVTSSTTTESTTTTLPAPTTTATTAPTTTVASTTTQPDTSSNPTAYPGRPSAGKIYWGAAVGGNTDPTSRHEIPAGAPLAVRRTFFQWSQRSGYMVNIASGDIANGRLPWVSVKTPPWQEMADGLHDAEIDEMLLALDGIGGPVWLTVHHEPEGGGGVNSPDDPAGPAGHLAMNIRVRQRMEALGVDNIALAPILMDWTWESSSGRDPNEWWDSSVYDFIGVDHYVCYSNASSCEHDSLLNSTWTKVLNWAKAKGVDVAVGEWGMRGTDEDARTRMRAWYDSAASSAGAGRVVALSAFDSDQNVPSSYFLTGTQLEEFQILLTDSRTASVK